MFVESLLELHQRLPEFLDRVEGSHPQELFLQRADEPLRYAVAFRGLDEARAGLDTQETELPLEGMAHVLWPMVVPEHQAGWPVSRLSASRLSPRSRRRTTSCLRLADRRFTDFLLMDTSRPSHSTTKCVSSLFGGAHRVVDGVSKKLAAK